MTWIALKMLTGDRSKYFAIIFGVTFACFLIAEQSATFCGVMLRTTSQIRDTHGADIWVMNPDVRYVDDLKAISDNDVFRVRGVPGVAWAVNLYRGQGQAQLANGNYQGVILMGLDDATPGRGARPTCWSASSATCKSPTRSSWTRPASTRCGRASRCAPARSSR